MIVDINETNRRPRKGTQERGQAHIIQNKFPSGEAVEAATAAAAATHDYLPPVQVPVPARSKKSGSSNLNNRPCSSCTTSCTTTVSCGISGIRTPPSTPRPAAGAVYQPEQHDNSQHDSWQHGIWQNTYGPAVNTPCHPDTATLDTHNAKEKEQQQQQLFDCDMHDAAPEKAKMVPEIFRPPRRSHDTDNSNVAVCGHAAEDHDPQLQQTPTLDYHGPGLLGGLGIYFEEPNHQHHPTHNQGDFDTTAQYTVPTQMQMHMQLHMQCVAGNTTNRDDSNNQECRDIDLDRLLFGVGAWMSYT